MTYAIDKYTKRLRERVFAIEDDFIPWTRGLEAVKAYRDHPGLPAALKRAQIISSTLAATEPVILEEELIHGPLFRDYPLQEGVNEEKRWKLIAAYPEIRGCASDWHIPKDVDGELKFWSNKTIRANNIFAEKYEWISKYEIAQPHGTLGGHTLPDHGILLDNGIGSLISRLLESMQNEKQPEKLHEFLAMKQCLEALSAFCRKYAQALRNRTETTQDPVLKARLAAGARDMDSIAWHAPESFPQALQLLQLSHFIDQLDNWGDASSFGRVDQFLLPYYERDIRNRTLTREDAFKLVCHFTLKNWKPQTSCNMTVGGLKRDGGDATNELSYLFLEAMELTEATVALSVRIHKNAPAEFLQTAARVIRRGYGRPSLYHDEVAINALVKKGVELEDARGYAPLGCAEVMIPGLTCFRTMGLGLQPLKIFELVLNKGCCMTTGDNVFDDIPEDFGSFQEFIGTYRKKVRLVIDLSMQISEEDERLEPLYRPRPWLTLLTKGGLEKGIDVSAGLAKYNSCGKTLASIADIVNSIYAVKRLVYQEKKLSLPQFRSMLQSDWDSCEPFRQYILNRLPRFGQDDEHVNAIAREEAAHYAKCFEGKTTYYGGTYWPMLFGLQYMESKTNIGASPCGRKKGDPVSATLQPSVHGSGGSITQILNSIASIDFTSFAGGISNVQEMDPSLFIGDDGLKRLTTLILGFFKTGGMEISINFINEMILEDAMKNPGEHMNLMVRLFGLSARFVTLSPEVQAFVMQRVRAAAKRAAI